MLASPVHHTLEEIVAAPHSALLVIDVQRDLCPPEYAPMYPRLRNVIDAAHRAGVYVVYVQNLVLRDGASQSNSETSRRTHLGMKLVYTVEGTPGAAFVDQIAPGEHDPVVRKHRLNSFEGTDLNLVLRARGIQTIICTGVATHGCVISTSYAAIALDYYVVVVSDCVASWKQDLHDASLLVMRNTMHRVVDSDELISVWESGNTLRAAAVRSSAHGTC
jgi:nicotinamidase-related amidase